MFAPACCGNTASVCDAPSPTPAPAPVPAPTTISGELSISVADPAAFVDDPDNVDAAAASVAQMASVAQEYVEVTLTAVSRRLGGSTRRLAGSVTVDYVI